MLYIDTNKLNINWVCCVCASHSYVDGGWQSEPAENLFFLEIPFEMTHELKKKNEAHTLMDVFSIHSSTFAIRFGANLCGWETIELYCKVRFSFFSVDTIAIDNCMGSVGSNKRHCISKHLTRLKWHCKKIVESSKCRQKIGVSFDYCWKECCSIVCKWISLFL